MSAVGVSESVVRPILAEAVDLARRALLELEPFGVGMHVGVTAEGDSAATHYFEATLPGYRGWHWAVVVAAPPEAGHVTVSESALLPGPEALVAPDFLPWDQRIRPGDLAPGDLLAPPLDDPRLVPGYLATGDPEIDEVVLELGFGRTQVLSRVGREDAADRWFSEFGPDTDMARAAPSTCGRCGFFVPLAGALHAAFGVCANAMGADGRVVHTEYGCGAHSDTELPTGAGSPAYEAYDDAAVDLIPNSEFRPAAAPEPGETGSAETESARVTETAPEAAAAEADSAPAADAATGETASGGVDPSATAGESASVGGPASAVESASAAESASVVETASVGQSASAGESATAGEAASIVETATAGESAAVGETATAAEVVAGASAEPAGAEPAAASAGVESGPAPEVPESAAAEPAPGLFDLDPDSVTDDAWAVAEVRVDAESAPTDSGATAE